MGSHRRLSLRKNVVYWLRKFPTWDIKYFFLHYLKQTNKQKFEIQETDLSIPYAPRSCFLWFFLKNKIKYLKYIYIANVLITTPFSYARFHRDFLTFIWKAISILKYLSSGKKMNQSSRLQWIIQRQWALVGKKDCAEGEWLHGYWCRHASLRPCSPRGTETIVW